MPKLPRGQFNPRFNFDPYGPRADRFLGEKINLDFDDLDITTIRVRTPVVTGFLQRNFVLENGHIVNETLYGDYVERGTSKMAPRFMVARSIPFIANRLARRVGEQLMRVDHFKGVIKRTG
jgi:hypothetical protein